MHLARIYRKEVNRMLTAYGISESQADPLLHLARFGSGMRQNSLAEEIGREAALREARIAIDQIRLFLALRGGWRSRPSADSQAH